jgi:tetratricopeptide (TPR) repeat protein
VNKPAVTTTTQLLPFSDLSPSDFERMCLWLVEGEGFLRAEQLGEAGTDQGRDIVAFKPSGGGEELWYFQCKRHKKITPATLKAEVDKVNRLIASDAAKRPACLVFVTSASVSARVREEVAAYCRDAGYECAFWARTELDRRVKGHPDIVAEFFGAAHVQHAVALHQLPPPPGDFTGRSVEIDRLTSAAGEGAAHTLGLFGMGGAGKTALALKLAEQLTPRYPDAQIYLDLKGSGREPLPVADAMLHVIRSYQPAAEPPASEAELAARYRSVLYGRRAILLLDNAAGRDQVEPLTPPAGWAVIVTSRQRFHLPGLISVSVGPLPRDDARALLSAIAPRVGGEADLISELCGHLPLALRLAGSALAEREDIGPEDYARRLTDTRRRLALVEASAGLSYELLNDLGRELWRRLSVFPGDFGPEGAAYIMGLALEAELARDVLSEFVGYSLVEWDAAKRRYRLHDLMRLFASERLSDAERRDCRLRYVNYYGAILTEANSLYPMGGAAAERALSTLDAEWDNIRAAQAWAEENTQEDDEAAAMCNAFPNAGAYLLDLRQNPRERVRWLEAALAAARILNARDSEGAHLANLGIAYTSAGEPRRAIKLLEQSLAVHRELGDRKGEAQVLGSLGSAYATIGDNKRAVEFYERDLALMRELGERRAEGAVLNNLANAYAALGEVSRAAGLYEEAVAILRGEGDRYGEGGALGSLGLLYADQGDNHLAMRLYEQALRISRELGDVRGEGRNLGNMGVALFNLGAYDEALECHNRQLDIARGALDPHEEACALGGLASVYTFTGEVRLAAECFEQAVRLFRRIGDRYMEGKTLGNWGNLFMKVGDARRAAEHYGQQLAIAREVGDRRGEAMALWNTGWALGTLGETAQAIEYGEAGLRLFDEVGDEKNAAKARWQVAQWHQDT